jgi:hypothetical protein
MGPIYSGPSTQSLTLLRSAQQSVLLDRIPACRQEFALSFFLRAYGIWKNNVLINDGASHIILYINLTVSMNLYIKYHIYASGCRLKNQLISSLALEFISFKTTYELISLRAYEPISL